ncbi:MAG: hypothetical protein FWE34_03835 [Defluviitaleaceae bacterium]|nr:hypothetical protein [Defluviitaleaceae bacterium]
MNTKTEYICFSIIDKSDRKAIGTIELFDKINNDKNQALSIIRKGAIIHIDLEKGLRKPKIYLGATNPC